MVTKVLISEAASQLDLPAIEIATNPEATKIEEYAAFDVLRFVLASAVALSHVGILRWDNAGNLAVQVFFALSGWLIGGILCKTDFWQLNRFYYNRSTRVWIPYFVCVLLLYMVSSIFERTFSTRWFQFLVYDLTFTHNWFSLWPNAAAALNQMPLKGTGNHFWSLAVEEQFYLVSPFLMTVLPFGKKVWVWTAITAFTYLSQSQYASISFGVLCAVGVKEWGDWQTSNWARIALIALFAASSMALDSRYLWAAPLFSITVVLLCAVPMRRTALTAWVGGVSFPFYLFAWTGIFVLHAVEKKLSFLTAYQHSLEFIAALGAASVIYMLLDRQVMSRRNRFYRPALGWSFGLIGYGLVITGIVTFIATR